MGNLRFIFGPSGSGKTTKIHKEILERAKKEPSRNFLVIVPDQFTMQTQQELSTGSETGGILNIDVLSFGRLTHRIMTEVGWEELPVLDDTGKSLVLQRVCGRIAADLPVLGRRMNRQGYIHEVKSVISEFMQYSLSPDEVSKLSETVGKGSALGSKLADLGVIYKEFNDYITGRFITREGKLDILRQVIPASSVLAGSVVVFDGFTGFTPIQLGVIEDIIVKADETIVTLVLGSDKKIGECLDMQELFYLSGKTYDSLVKRADKAGAQVLTPDFSDYRSRPSKIDFIEKNLFRISPEKYEKEDDDSVVLFCASNVSEEVHQAGLEIRRLLAENKDLQFRDIAFVSGDIEGYAPYIETEFQKMQIPYYIDRTSGIRLNPLIEGVRSVIDLYLKNFSSDSVFRYLKSGISGIERNDADILESYVRQTGIRGYKAWDKMFAIKTDDMSADDETALARINEVREKFISQVSGLCKITGDKQTVLRESTKAPASLFVNGLYDYLLSIDAAGILAGYAHRFEAEGDYVRQKEYDQIYRKLMELLEQIESLMGEDEISFKEFGEILDAGFGEIRVGTIPQSVDRVLVGDIERTRVPKVKILFFAGVNDGNIPRNTDKGGIISDLERESLYEKGLELAPSPREEMYNQRLYLYMNMTKPSERLYISWAGLDATGKSLRPSYLCEMIKDMFPGTEVLIPENEKKTSQIVTGSEGLRYLGEELRLYAEGNDAEKTPLYTIYSAFSGQEFSEKRDKLEKAAFFRYKPEKIEKALAEKLYCEKPEEGSDESVLRSSVSQLEAYANCPYKFFLRYGIKLKETAAFEIDNRDTGNVFHEVIDLFSKKLKEDGKNWRDFSDEYARDTVEELLQKVTDIYGACVFQDSARNRLNIYRLKKALVTSVLSIRYQIQKGAFEPEAFEVPFRRDVVLPGGKDKKRVLRLRGKIDRVDLAKKDGQVFVRIVDYKSSSKKLNPPDLYEGSQLQLPMYMDQEVKRLNEKGVKTNPASMLYYHVADPLLELPYESSEKDIETALRKENIMHGYTVGKEPSVSLNDKSLEEGNPKSDVISVAYTSKGGFSVHSEVLASDDFNTLMEYSEFIAKKQAGEILDGNIEVKPAAKGSCEYCSYRSSCGFDIKIPGYENSKKEKVKKTEMASMMRERMKKPE